MYSFPGNLLRPMPAMALGLGLPAPTGSGIALVPNTAFVSSAGNDGTGLVARQDMPFATLSAASAALFSAYGGSSALRIAFLGAITGNDSITLTNFTDLELLGPDPMTPLDTSVNIDLGFYDGSQHPILRVSYVNLNGTITLASTGGASTVTGPEIIGTTATINNLYTYGANGANTGNGGTSGFNYNGQPGINGLDDSIAPTDGTAGEDANSSGGGAGPGDNGIGAVSLTLRGTLSVVTLDGHGGNGADGGAGGDGASATSGGGGSGGNYTGGVDGSDHPGGNGGNAGNATATGGEGGAGGTGGDGAVISYEATVTINSSSLSGGIGGMGGSGGAAGSASCGSAGSGGSGVDSVGGLLAGNPGSNGNAINNPGAGGTNGSDGNNGSLTLI